MASRVQKSVSAKAERLTLDQLISYDDVSTDALVDQVYFWANIRKNRTKYFPARGLPEEEVARILRNRVVVEKDPSQAEVELLKLPGLRRFLDRLKTPREKDNFRRHLRRYINIYLPDCAFEVNTTNRYTIVQHEAAITARRDIRKGEIIKYLNGVQLTLTQEEEQNLDLTRRDFSVVVSSRKRTVSIFLGPARFANHDCDANAKLSTIGLQGMEVVAIKPIYVGDEITVSYGEDYFGTDNCECLCRTCETLGRNGWNPDEKGLLPSREIQDDNHPTIPRKKRKLDHVRNSMTPSATPDLRPATALEKPQPDPVEAGTQGIKREPEEDVLKISNTETSMRAPEPSVPAVSILTDSLGDDSATSENSQIFSMTGSSNQSTDLTESTSISDEPAFMRLPTPESLGETPKTHILLISAPQVGENSSTIPRVELRGESELSSISQWEIDETSMVALRESNLQARTQRSSRRSSVASTIESTTSLKRRIAGDYTRTPRLLAKPFDRWVVCRVCDGDFVQSDSYFTRAACPRCEKHSKLYGYQWPKTDKEGKNDKEQRVMDHRTVHRFIYPDEERQIKKKDRGLGTPGLADDSSRAQSEVTDSGTERRSPRRKRRLRLTM